MLQGGEGARGLPRAVPASLGGRVDGARGGARDAIDALHTQAADRVVASLLSRGEEPRHLHPKQKECVLLVLADAVAKDPRARAATQRRFIRGTLAAKKGKEPNAEYRFYEGWSRPLRRVAGHAWLALERASKAKALSITIDPGGDDKEAVRDLAQCLNLRHSKFAAPALKDAWTRLLKPRGRREAKRDGLLRAKDEAIACFASNVKKLLEQAPPLIDDGSVLAVDPGFRHGHKCCIVSGRDGSLLTHLTVDAPGAEDDMKQASKRLDGMIGDHTITCVAIGDGTNTRGAQRLVASTPKLSKVPRAVVRECGASVYSASDSAAKEFGEAVPLSARGAASLARRLLDPLGGLPASISLHVSRRWRLPSTPSSRRRDVVARRRVRQAGPEDARRRLLPARFGCQAAAAGLGRGRRGRREWRRRRRERRVLGTFRKSRRAQCYLSQGPRGMQTLCVAQ